MQGELRNAKHIKQWHSSLTPYAFPVIGDKAVADVSVEDMMALRCPIWSTKNETASRVRQRVKAVLDWAKVMGLRDGENPARWKGNLQQHLPSPGKVQQENRFPAVAQDKIAAWFCVLRTREGMAAGALEFLTLTASRSGEIRGAARPAIELSRLGGGAI